jgi:diguanylate cyclase (GGDEF)-like protein
MRNQFGVKVEIQAVDETEKMKDIPILENSTARTFEYDDTRLCTMLTTSESSNIMRRMLQSIDLEEVVKTYFELLSTKLPCTSIKISFGDQNLFFGNSTQNARNMKISLDYGHPLGAPQHAQLTYVFSQVLSPGQRKLLSEIHAIYAMGLKHALEHYRIRQLATKDMLTGLCNRTHFNDSLHKLISISLRNEQSFGLLILDLDNFKQVNDLHGHQQGDEVLIEFANLLTNSLRDSDHAFRFGGDEFCCLLIESDQEANEQVAKRIQNATAEHPLFKEYQVSTSVGATTFQTDDTQKTLFKRADMALYKAKHAGKNLFKAA